jgi:uncharacterized coiled-coil protein SlyX
MSGESLEQIQSKIAYLERAATDLSDVVFRHHNQIKALEAQLQALKEQLGATQLEDPTRSPDQERPPHY